MKIINARTGLPVPNPPATLADAIKAIKKLANREDVKIYRERVAYNDYRIEIWLDSPLKPNAVHAFSILEINRKGLLKAADFINGKPKRAK